MTLTDDISGIHEAGRADEVSIVGTHTRVRR